MFATFRSSTTGRSIPAPAAMASMAAWSSAGARSRGRTARSARLFARRARLGEVARNIAIWGVVVAVLATGYTYRDELGRVGARLHSELLPGDPVASSDAHVLTLTQDEGGDFYLYGSASGARIRFL